MDQLPERLRARAEANADRETRVVVWTVGGTQIGIPGVGEGDNRLTFPRHFVVGEALNAGFQHGWLRFAAPGEMMEDDTWYRIYEHPEKLPT